MRTLVLGYGNRDRQDDGVAWHLLVEIRKRLGFKEPFNIDEFFGAEDSLTFVFQLQLMPELVEDIAPFDRICFLDCHTGSVPEDIHYEIVTPIYQHSPLTHHLTPNSLLSILQTVYDKTPEAILISIKGNEFGYSPELSSETANLIPQAAQIVIGWMTQKK